MRRLKSTFGTDRPLIGMVHLGPSPGTPAASDSPAAVAKRAAREAAMLASAGFDALIVENFFDRPYLRRTVGPEVVAAVTRAALEIRRAVGPGFPIGVQILAGANHESLAVAHATEAQFIRVEGFVFAAVADEGLLDSADAGPLLRFRRAINADAILVFADIDKKHSAHAITADVDLPQMAQAAEFFGADGVIITGSATGKPTSLADLRAARSACNLPVFVGSGATPASLPDLFAAAHGIIVGSWYKQGGDCDRPPDPKRARALVKAANAARKR